MDKVTVVGHVDAQHRLSAAVPESVPPGPVTIQIVAVPQEIGDDDWMKGVARQWHEDLSDSRQDIYTLSDGEPVDAS